MYAKYVTNTTSTLLQVISDIAALLSGANIASLSASCDKVNSTLISTVAPGWTLVETVSASTYSVLSAPDADGLTTKYVKLVGATTTIDVVGYESWSTGTHTGTSPTSNVSTALSGYSTSAINTYYVFATPRSFWIANATQGVGAIEMTRDCAYLKGTTYPCFGVVSYAGLSGSSNTMYFPRIKTLNSTGDSLASSAVGTIGTITARGSNATTQGVYSTNMVGNGSNYYEMRSIWVLSSAFTSWYGPILGKLYDVIEFTKGTSVAFDTFSDGTNTWMVVPSSTYSIAFKQA